MCTRNYFNIRIMPGLIILSCVTFLCAATVASISLYAIIKEENQRDQFNGPQDKTHHLQHVFNINLDRKSIEVIVGFFFVISILAMGFSVFLLIGVTKNISAYVVAYFSFGVTLLIIVFLVTLMAFLHGFWFVGIATLILFMAYIPCLKVVHTAYEVLHKGMSFGFYGHNLLMNEEVAE